MDGDEPGTPEWWPENPWAKEIQEITSYQARPSKYLVSATVQKIFEVAKDRAEERRAEKMQARREEIRQLKESLPHRYRGAKIQLQFASGKTQTVTLSDENTCLRHIQRNSKDPDVCFSKAKLTIPGNPEPLGDLQDLRDLLPDHPVLEIWLSDEYGSDSSLGSDAYGK